ncbi:MAG: hypothetical protein K8S99_00550 [Planctomycetes bacterium]|nr:hypothetical protein [Planctomycetota bacterium]
MMLSPLLMLAYTPFRDPMPLDTYWLLLLPPLVLAIALVYKTIKLDDLSLLPRQATFLAGQIIAFMVLAAAALWLITEIF